MFVLAVATGPDLAWACSSVETFHYLRRRPDSRSRPLCYTVSVKGEKTGCLFFGRPEATRCYQGELTYGDSHDLCAGRVKFDRWEILNLCRFWLAPDVQTGGRLCQPGTVPGFRDRCGLFRGTLASAAIGAALARVNYDYLMAYPPCFVEEPYRIRAVLSYCDRNRHKGTVYAAAGFALARRNVAGIETWWTDSVAPLSAREDGEVRAEAARNRRSRRLRHERDLPYLWVDGADR